MPIKKSNEIKKEKNCCYKWAKERDGWLLVSWVDEKKKKGDRVVIMMYIYN